MPPRPPTLLDVARRANVAKSTASRALHNPGRISRDTAAKVLKVAGELGYVSDGVARAMTTRRTHTVGAVIPTLQNAIYALSTHSLEQHLQKAGYMLLVASHEFDLDTETRAVEAFVSRGVDAVALVGSKHRKRTMDMLRRAGVPYVLTWTYRKGDPASIGFDNEHAARVVARHLLRLGHRRFGMIAGVVRDNDRAAARLRGVRAELTKAGVQVPDSHVVERPYSFEAGCDGLQALLRLRRRPTAVICGNDVVAIGALHEAARQGLDVPRDLSITGFDDMPFAAFTTPALTTVHFPMEEIGERSAAYLLNALRGGHGGAQEQLPIELVVRDSTGPAPG